MQTGDFLSLVGYLHNMKRTQWCSVLLLLICCTGVAAAQDNGGEYYAFLFSSDGCGSCGDADMYVFIELTASYPELVVVDYELSGHAVNAAIYREFSEAYNVRQSVPMIILGQNLTFVGKGAIIDDISPIFDAQRNGTPPSSGSLMRFETLDLSSLEGYPKIWRANRVLIFEDEGADNAFLKELIDTPNINTTLSGHTFETISPLPIRVGKQELSFDHAVRVEGWVLQWNETEMPVDANSSVATPLSVCGSLSALGVLVIAALRKQRR
jgi:hypothetical protein